MKYVVGMLALLVMAGGISAQNRYGGLILEKSSTSASTRKVIQLLQYDLYFLGYGIYLESTGGATGQYTDATMNAVKAFQKDRGMTQHGVVGQRTTLEIEKALAKTDVGDKWSSFNPLRYQGRRLKRGDTDAQSEGAVSILQGDLATLGFTPEGAMGGSFDEATETALRTFQQEALVPVTGILDEPTVTGLAKQICLRSEQ